MGKDMEKKFNRIVFGAPGTGKSFKVNEESKVIVKENKKTYGLDDFTKDIVAICKEKDICYKLLNLGFKNPELFEELKRKFGGQNQISEKLLGKENRNIAYVDWGAKLARDCGLNSKKENSDLFFERVTFHPNYSYAQFVGTYKPVKEVADKNSNFDVKQETGITYEYVPGPFIRILKKALYSKQVEDNKKYLLVIEEINRANMAAVFGDVFQLLDRDGEGRSEYTISTSEDLRDYLISEGINERTASNLYIPSNMYIWATMNSADQGVFPMDTAFKRRWDFEYLPLQPEWFDENLWEKNFNLNELTENNLDEQIKKLKFDEFSEPVTKEEIKEEIRSYVKMDYFNWQVEGRGSWNDIRTKINGILRENVEWINEDKLLGPWFIKPDNDKIISTESFCSKVLMYLYEDVVKIDPSKIFDKNILKSKESSSGKQIFFSEIKKAWNKKGMEIFKGGD